MVRLQHRIRSLGVIFWVMVLVGTLVACASTPPPPPSSCSLPPPPSEEAVVADRPIQVVTPYFPPPDRLDLCGEPVPLDLQDVQERFDREFTLIVYNHAQVYLWLKRMEREHPLPEMGLSKAGIRKMIARLHEELGAYEGTLEVEAARV